MRSPGWIVLVAACAGEAQAPPPPGCADAVRDALPALWAGWSVPRDETAVWGALSSGLTGEALTDAYVATWTRRAAMDAQATSITPLGHDVESLRVLPGPDCGADVTWTLRVALAHQGHRHPRVLRQRARLMLEAGRIARRVPSDVDLVDEVATDPLLGDPSASGHLPADELIEAGLLDVIDSAEAP